MKTTTILLSTLLFFTACESTNEQSSKNDSSSSSKEESAIKPIEGLEIPDRVYSINANEFSQIDLPNGGSIVIKENTLVDKNGNVVQGKVDINWKEFHSLTDILLSGIPMKYDSAGVCYDFVSGGMFTISASQKEEEVKVKAGSSISVNLASSNDQVRFSFFKLNEKTGDWSYNTTADGKPTQESKKVVPPTIIDAQVDLSAFPELKNKRIVGWKSLDRLTKAELKTIKEDASLVSLEGKKDNYKLNFKRFKGDKKINVEPFLLTDALDDDQRLKEEMNLDYDELLSYQNNLTEGKVVRSMEIENFGTYNWDVKNKRAQSKGLVAEFDYGRDINPKLISLYLVSPEENMIVKYDSGSDENFSFDPKLKNYLVAILPENKIYAVRDSGFDKARKSPEGSHFTFSFEDLGVKVKSGEELGRNILNILELSQ